jgi:MinD superfamily P-loop ATPase
MPNFENYCRCPGCGECSAHANAPKLKTKLKALQAELAEARRDVAELLALSDIVVKVENRAALVAEIRKRYGLDAAIDAARGEP